MNYELAKELKEAGFPQGENLDNIIAQGTALAYLRESKPSKELLEKYEDALGKLKELYQDDVEYVYVPTLSELIEACGDDFFQLTKGSGLFFAEADIDTEPQFFNGSTPEEVVANLWLGLNKK